MTRIFWTFVWIFCCAGGAWAQRDTVPFNDGWRFARFGEQADGTVVEEPAAQAEAFDDASWRALRLPHDWGVESPFLMSVDGSQGRLPYFGIGWYRKRFTLPEEDQGRRVFLDLDGAMSDSTVWLNGLRVGGRPYGYASFRVELTPYLHAAGTPNTLAVRLDNKRLSARWYPGGGLYRNVWLVKTAPVHVGQWGVWVRAVTHDTGARIEADVSIESGVTGQVPVEVSAAVYELGPGGSAPDGRSVATAAPVSAQVAGEARVSLAAALKRVRLWDTDAPNLYRLDVTVRSGGQTVDVYPQIFGVRTLTFDPQKGFFLNGKHRQIKGVCMHHDLGALGAAVHRRALERQLEILRSMGCDAIRTSHNPPAPELLDLADRMGFMVLDEAFDMWEKAKTRDDYARFFKAWHERDLTDLIRRDRNHPSVIMWSIGNEVIEQTDPENGVRIGKRLTEIAHREDPTRPTVLGNWRAETMTNGLQEVTDVFGANYLPQLYGEFSKRNPGRGLLGSETVSMVSSRGEYFLPVPEGFAQPPMPFPEGYYNFQVSSYDVFSQRPNNCPPDVEFLYQSRNQQVFGEFVWTGFDYLGEPSPYERLPPAMKWQSEADRARWADFLAQHPGQSPARSSYYGIVDLCGFPKDRFYAYQARWRPELRMAHILPHWTWPERAGQKIPVHVYTSGDEAELFVNGRSQGRKSKGADTFRLQWNNVVYEPGEVRVTAYRKNQKWAEAVQRTAGEASRLEVKADRDPIAGDGADLCYVTVRVLDARGVLVPRADPLLRFAVSGPVEIAGVCNGDATDLTGFQAAHQRVYNGLCQVILRGVAGRQGTAALTVRSDNPRIPEATVRIRVR